MTDSLADIDVYDIDQYVGAVPHEKFRRLRAEAPVFKHHDPESADGFWALTRHADVVFVSRNPELFSSYEKTAMINEYAQEQVDQQRLFMLNQDPPHHTRTRSLVNRGFTPRMIARLEERIQATCDDIVATAVAKGEGDFVTLCAAELPLIVIAELMGVPLEDRHKVFDWSNRMVGGDDPEYGVTEEQRFEAATEMWAYASALAETKRESAAGRHRQQADQPGRGRQRAERARVRPVLHAARGRRQRDHAQRDLRRNARADPAPRAVGQAAGRPEPDPGRRRRDRPLGHTGQHVPADRDRRTSRSAG